MQGNSKSSDGFKKMKANVEQKVKENVRREESSFSESGGLKLKCYFEHRRSGWGKSEGKAVCFECGNTDHFKAQCPIWIKKKKKWAVERPTNTNWGPKGHKGQGKGIAVHFSCLESGEMATGNEEIPDGELNLYKSVSQIHLLNQYHESRGWGRKELGR